MPAALTYRNGAPIEIGDRVGASAIVDGTPKWAIKGTVVKLARVRVGVEWDSFSYAGRGPHMANPSTLTLQVPDQAKGKS
jgi:hypothetical protein